VSIGANLTRRLLFVLCIAILTSTLAYSISIWIPKEYCLESHIHLDGAMSPEPANLAIYYLEYYLFRTRLVEERVAKLMGNAITVEALTAAREISLSRDSLSAHIILFWPEPVEGKRLLELFTREAIELAVTKKLVDKRRELELLTKKIEQLKLGSSKCVPHSPKFVTKALLNQYQQELVNQALEISFLNRELESLPWEKIVSGPYINPKMERPLKAFNAVVGFIAGVLLALIIIGLRIQRRSVRN
jgi:hypothetical protein